MPKKVDSSSLEKKKEDKALFIQRLFAFIIDVLLVSVLVSLLTTPFVKTENNDNYNEQLNSVISKLQKKEIDTKEYIVEYSNIYYKISRDNGIVSIVTIFFNVLYFVVYQIYTNGQTLGKKIMKIRVKSDDGDLFYNQMIFRSFLANFILIDLLSFALMLLSPRNVYFYSVVILTSIQYIFVFISIVMIMNRKDGCAIHDKIVHTRVIQEKNKEIG